MLSLLLSSPSYTPVVPLAPARASAPTMKAKGFGLEDLKGIALEQNTAIGYWDPLKLAERNFFELGEEGTIGWLRHAEIKHGRVAMAGFVGYCVQANGLYFPWALTGGPLSSDSSVMFADISAAGGPEAQWDALPTAAKLQFFGFILLLEWIGETGTPHYTKGGKPGLYPSLKEAVNVPHPVPFDPYDPFGFFEGMDEETKARRLNMEVNNGRLAMIGIFSFICSSKGLIVPPLDGLIEPYAGDPMAPFSEVDAGLPFVADMLKAAPKIFAGIGNNPIA